MSPARSTLPRLALAPLALAALAAAGCTVNVVMPEVAAAHPASPMAESAPLPPPSPLLDSYRPVEAPPEMRPMSHEGMDHGAMEEGVGHEGMNHGAMEGMDHEGMDHGSMDEGMSHEGMTHDPEPAESSADAPAAHHEHGEEPAAPAPPPSRPGGA